MAISDLVEGLYGNNVRGHLLRFVAFHILRWVQRKSLGTKKTIKCKKKARRAKKSTVCKEKHWVQRKTLGT